MPSRFETTHSPCLGCSSTIPGVLVVLVTLSPRTILIASLSCEGVLLFVYQSLSCAAQDNDFTYIFCKNRVHSSILRLSVPWVSTALGERRHLQMPGSCVKRRAQQRQGTGHVAARGGRAEPAQQQLPGHAPPKTIWPNRCAGFYLGER